MPVPALISDLSATPSLNSPQGTESAKGVVDDYLRAHAAFIKQVSNLVLGSTVTLPSAATVNIGFAASLNIAITGTTTISAFDLYAEGALRYVQFLGAMTLTHNAAVLALPGAADILTVSGDVGVFKSLGAGKWTCLVYQRIASPPTLTSAQVTTALGFTPQDSARFAPAQILDIGQHIDFHCSSAANDYDARISCTAPTGGNGTSSISVDALSFTVTGNISASVVTQTSDERKKCNWRPLTDEQLDALANMERAGLFDWIEGGTSLGGSAQEIARIVPQAVYEDERGDLTVNYGGLCFAVQQATLRRLWGKK